MDQYQTSSPSEAGMSGDRQSWKRLYTGGLRDGPAAPTWWGSEDHNQGHSPFCLPSGSDPRCPPPRPRWPVRLLASLASALVPATEAAERLVPRQTRLTAAQIELLCLPVCPSTLPTVPWGWDLRVPGLGESPHSVTEQ